METKEKILKEAVNRYNKVGDHCTYCGFPKSKMDKWNQCIYHARFIYKKWYQIWK